MTPQQYDKELGKLLGISGPMGIIPCPDGTSQLVYRLPDGGQIFLAPPQDMTPEQRADTIESLRSHLGDVAQNRKKSTDKDH